MADEYDAGNIEHVRKAKADAAYKQAKEKIFLRTMMASREGRDWVYKVLARSHIYSTSFSTNALTMAYSEGERNAGLQIMLEIVRASPEHYLEMLAENGDSNV